VNGFTCREARETRSYQTVSVRLDSKGRISIPVFLRKNYGLEKGSILLGFNLKENVLFLCPTATAYEETRNNRENSLSSMTAYKESSLGFRGQGGVIGSTKACGVFSPGPSPGPDPQSKTLKSIKGK
jgi:bifunctional DNA-binding transcriptional regulator/antitoxin component of YhaV-PrlF toxin-antitoxin module